MSETKNKDLQKLRIEICVKLCQSHPKVWDAVISEQTSYIEKNDKVTFVIVEALTRLEPSIRHILSYYHKRERR